MYMFLLQATARQCTVNLFRVIMPASLFVGIKNNTKQNLVKPLTYPISNRDYSIDKGNRKSSINHACWININKDSKALNYIKQRRLQKTIIDISKAIELKPYMLEAYARLTFCHYKLGNDKTRLKYEMYKIRRIKVRMSQTWNTTA